MKLTLKLLRKYRFSDPTSFRSKYRVYGQFLKFFIAWNGIGYLIYKFMQRNTREKDPEFDNKSSGQQVMSMMGYTDAPTKYLFKYDKEKGFTLNKVSAQNSNQADNTNAGNSEQIKDVPS